MEDIDIWRTAQLLISQHGEDAEIQAAMRADCVFEQAHGAAELVWKRVMKAIQILARTSPLPGTSRH